MSIDVAQGIFLNADQCPSPNCDSRPDDSHPELIVIHAISLPPNQYGGPWIDQLFQNCLDQSAHPYFNAIAKLKVSTHLLIRRDGSRTQYVPFHMRAWHTGVSTYQGRDNCNDFSIGIELEGCDTDPFTSAQYEQLATTLSALMQHYPDLSRDQIVGHSDIAPGRKTDPGPQFQWGRLQQLLDAKLSAEKTGKDQHTI